MRSSIGIEVQAQLRPALIQKAEQHRRQHDAERMVAPHQCHRNADEALAPSALFNSSFSDPPMTVLIAIIPARAPEISIASMVTRVALIPAQRAAASDLPKARTIAQPGAPQQHPDQPTGGKRNEQRHIGRHPAVEDQPHAGDFIQRGQMHERAENRPSPGRPGSRGAGCRTTDATSAPLPDS